jgi:chemotaxis receptor (MCP) glutamine deamidase CheD
MSSSQAIESEDSAPNSSQFVTSSKKHRGAAYRPWAFTEHGAIMTATVLKSAGAAFVRLGIKLAGGKSVLASLLVCAIMSV